MVWSPYLFADSEKETIMTDQNLTEIICVIDRSGSMENIRADAIGGFNTFLEEQQKDKSDRCLLTYTQFDTEYDVIHESKPIEDVPPLDQSTYQPRGGTALLDAIGKTINDAGRRFEAVPEENRPGAVVFVILTDGEENSSKKYTREQVFDMIAKQRDQFNWQFLFLAANQDAIQSAAQFGIGAQNAATFSANAGGVQGVYGNLSKGVSGYRETKCSADLKVDDAVVGNDGGVVGKGPARGVVGSSGS